MVIDKVSAITYFDIWRTFSNLKYTGISKIIPNKNITKYATLAILVHTYCSSASLFERGYRVSAFFVRAFSCSLLLDLKGNS